ncbi:uncharacterized protein LOC141729163 [Zonotrichia albicollis]|uniref:uncharacterized protein LOC141729163 n=1 Tax=Zonotrichia albicollis TaxID=44394 RepID=UPI003D80B832
MRARVGGLPAESRAPAVSPSPGRATDPGALCCAKRRHRFPASCPGLPPPGAEPAAPRAAAQPARNGFLNRSYGGKRSSTLGEPREKKKKKRGGEGETGLCDRSGHIPPYPPKNGGARREAAHRGARGAAGSAAGAVTSPGLPVPPPPRVGGGVTEGVSSRPGGGGTAGGPPLLPPPRCLLPLFFPLLLLLLLTGGTARAPPPRPLLLPRGRGAPGRRAPGGLLWGGPRSVRHEAAPPLDGRSRRRRRRSGRCTVRVALPPGRARPPGHRHGRARTHTHTRTDTQRDGADAEIPEVPPCRPPGRASPRPRPPGPPRPGAAGETHRRAAHPAAATTFHPGRQPAAAASPSAAGSGRGRKYEEEARRALRRGAPFLARDAGFAGGGCAAAVGFLHQLRGCVCIAHTCVSVCVRSPCRVTLPAPGLPSLLPHRWQESAGPPSKRRGGPGWALRP